MSCNSRDLPALAAVTGLVVLVPVLMVVVVVLLVPAGAAPAAVVVVVYTVIDLSVCPVAVFSAVLLREVRVAVLSCDYQYCVLIVSSLRTGREGGASVLPQLFPQSE